MGSWIKVLFFDLDQAVLIGVAAITPILTAGFASRVQSESVGLRVPEMVSWLYATFRYS